MIIVLIRLCHYHRGIRLSKQIKCSWCFRWYIMRRHVLVIRVIKFIILFICETFREYFSPPILVFTFILIQVILLILVVCLVVLIVVWIVLSLIFIYKTIIMVLAVSIIVQLHPWFILLVRCRFIILFRYILSITRWMWWIYNIGSRIGLWNLMIWILARVITRFRIWWLDLRLIWLYLIMIGIGGVVFYFIVITWTFILMFQICV